MVLSTDTEAGGNKFTQAHVCGTPGLLPEISMCNLHIPINDLDAALEGLPRKFADDTELGAAVDTLQGREGWAITSHMKFNRDKCWALHLGWGNPGCVWSLGNERLESSPVERDLGVLASGKLNGSQQEATSGEV